PRWRAVEGPVAVRKEPAPGGHAARKDGAASDAAPGVAPARKEPAAATAAPHAGSIAPAAPTSRSSGSSRTASAAPASRAATVELLVRSTPTGASIVRLDTGQRLGKTPLRVNVPKKNANVWLKLTLEGYAPVRFVVDLRKDNTASVTLRGAKKAARKH
ncbi:MAG TPA: PEGA domain-containing protein, partial [Anaeromyxobacter sp.]